MAENYLDERLTNRHSLEKKLEAAAWGLFFIWIGIAVFGHAGWGAGLIGVGIITLGAQVARKYFSLRLEGFWVAVGFLFVVSGIWKLYNIHVRILPMGSIPIVYQNYILLPLLWIAYCAVHSALISTTATNFLKRALGEKYRFYRLFFNTFSLVTLIALLKYSHSPRWNAELLFTWEGYMRIIQYGLIALAAILVVTSARQYSMGQFLGIRQILRKRSGNAMTESGELDSSGVLGVIRHPWYVAVFILLWASDQNRTGIVINLILSAYLVIGTLLEERKLVLEFGDKYKEYQRQVSMFIPLKWLRSRLHI